MIPLDERRSYLARQVGTLALSHVRSANPMAVVRAAAWSNRMGRLGVHLPLFVIHDFGVLMTASQTSGVSIGSREPPLESLVMSRESKRLFTTVLRQYQTLLETIALSELVDKATTWRL